MKNSPDKKLYPEELKVPVSGSRLDKYVAEHLRYSRSRIKKEIEKGSVIVNGDIKNAHYVLKKGDLIRYNIISNTDKRHITPQDLPLDVIEETPDYVIINKPPGLVVHPAPGNRDGTLLNGLMNRYETPYLVHRLDKDTSGVMIAALNEESAAFIKNEFKKKEVKKIYLALVNGVIKEEAGEIDIPVKRDGRDRTKMRAGWTGARKSVTRYRVIEQFNNATYVEAYPLTGRTHQIRVHFGHRGHVLLGDRKYGSSPYRAPRQMLHAWQISFKDPGSCKRVTYKVDPPADFKKVLILMQNPV